MIYLLYSLFILMLVFGLGLLALPFIAEKKIKWFFASAFFISTLSFSIYLVFTDVPNLKMWLTQGERHYKILTQFEQLGGVDGAIKKIKMHLEKNPQDARGWTILGKLYLATQQDAEAKIAFKRAEQFRAVPR